MGKLGVDSPIYYGLSIRSPQYIKFIRDCGGQGFFLRSIILQYYDELEK